MRIQLKLTPNNKPVPFNHLHELTRRLHHWLGRENALHDGLSLYSFGWLKGATATKGGLNFPSGAIWQISFFSEEAARKLLMGIVNEPELFYGLRVYEVQEMPTPAFGEQFRFMADGPVIARTVREDGTREYLLHDSPAADAALTATLRHKLEKAGISAEGLKVSFDRTYQKARHKLIDIKGIKHKGSLCPVLVEGSPEAVQFAWIVGAGELTGSGFGGLM